jgi:hypothetical protein
MLGMKMDFSGRTGMSLGIRGTMGTAGATRLGASAKGLVHDLFDGSHAAATLGAAPETPIDLPRCARRALPGNGIADVMVGEDVAGTDDHGIQARS